MIGEKLTKNKIVGSAIAFIGACLVMTQGSLSFSANISGDIIALIGTVVWALYTVIGKPLNEKYSALTVLNYVFLFGTLELLPFYILGLHASPFELAGEIWLSMGFLTICCTLIAFLIYNYGLEKLPASTIGVFMYIGPISGVLLAVLILNESLTLYTALGLVLILFGIYRAERKGISASISE
jgi:drug/metabolite transporter (DMT)-like permease